MGVHDGHRKNLRQNFLQVGLSGKTEHQALELLLTYSIPRVDVNPIAHQLIDRFGSLSKVIDADPAELMKVNYVTENTVVLLKLIPELSAMYSESKWKHKTVLSKTSEVVDYLAPKFNSRRTEALYMLCLDARLQLNELVLLSEGTPSHTDANLRKLVNRAIQSDAKQIILAHNHPSGVCAPSVEDIAMTKNIQSLLIPLDIKLIDHFIFSGYNYFSLRSNGFIDSEK